MSLLLVHQTEWCSVFSLFCCKGFQPISAVTNQAGPQSRMPVSSNNLTISSSSTSDGASDLSGEIERITLRLYFNKNYVIFVSIFIETKP